MNDIVNCPPLSWEQFVNIPDGTRVFNYGADQCVALANQYHIGTIGGTLQGTYINSAYQWWTDFEKYPQFTSVYDKVLNNPQPGDIFVTTRSSQYDPVHGHIGVVVRAWDGSTFGTMEQNAGSGAKRWVWRYNRGMSNIYGFLRPKSVTPPETISENNDMYAVAQFDDGWAGFWNMSTGQTGHIDTVEEWQRITPGTKIYKFADAAAFDAWKRKYGNVLPLSVDVDAIAQAVVAELGNTEVNVDAIAQAVADKIDCSCDCGCGIPVPEDDGTTKADILEAIETNYPEDK